MIAKRVEGRLASRREPFKARYVIVQVQTSVGGAFTQATLPRGVGEAFYERMSGRVPPRDRRSPLVLTVSTKRDYKVVTGELKSLYEPSA